jgi:hypothetical protein
MQPMWKATLGFLVMILLLTGGGLIAGRYVFAPWERILYDSSQSVVAGSRSSDHDLTDKQYKKIRLSFNSFDLAAGLTKTDLETIPVSNTYFFAVAWLCLGLVFILRKPRKDSRN